MHTAPAQIHARATTDDPKEFRTQKPVFELTEHELFDLLLHRNSNNNGSAELFTIKIWKSEK